MRYLKQYTLCIIHRHTGGLETSENTGNKTVALHRHIGGLEMSNTHTFDLSTLHRHIGGLETMSA